MCILILEAEIRDSSKELTARLLSSIVIRGVGGFGHKGNVIIRYPPVPKDRKPDTIREEKTDPNQAILYRINSDLNPLHIDPDMAAMGGFDRPIIHGLCSFGFTARSVYEAYCNGDSDNIVKVGGRFTSHVFPGETYVVEMWK